MRGSLLLTYALPHSPAEHEAPARFGYIVSQAVGNAVTRNLIRRRLKALTDNHLGAGFSGADVVFRALPSSASATFHELGTEVERALRDIAARSSTSAAPRAEHA